MKKLNKTSNKYAGMKKPTPTEINEQDQPEQQTSSSSTDGEVAVVRWANRRKMAWRAFWALVIYTPFFWMILPLWFHYWNLPTTWLEIIGQSFFWFATTMAAVIISYMGFTSLPFWGKGTFGSKDRVKMYDDDY